MYSPLNIYFALFITFITSLLLSFASFVRLQTAEYGGLKGDLLTASRHGESLLACIKRTDHEQAATISSKKQNRQKSLPNQSSLDNDPQSHKRDSYTDRSSESFNGFSDRRTSQSLDQASTHATDHSGNDRSGATSYSSVDRLTYVTAVERLLVQLEETEATFDDFWLQHHSRLTQCLQLRRFEADFKDILVRNTRSSNYFSVKMSVILISSAFSCYTNNGIFVW